MHLYTISTLKSFLKFPIVSPKFLLKKKPKNRHVFFIKKMWSQKLLRDIKQGYKNRELKYKTIKLKSI